MAILRSMSLLKNSGRVYISKLPVKGVNRFLNILVSKLILILIQSLFNNLFLSLVRGSQGQGGRQLLQGAQDGSHCQTVPGNNKWRFNINFQHLFLSLIAEILLIRKYSSFSCSRNNLFFVFFLLKWDCEVIFLMKEALKLNAAGRPIPRTDLPDPPGKQN